MRSKVLGALAGLLAVLAVALVVWHFTAGRRKSTAAPSSHPHEIAAACSKELLLLCAGAFSIRVAHLPKLTPSGPGGVSLQLQ